MESEQAARVAAAQAADAALDQHQPASASAGTANGVLSNGANNSTSPTPSTSSLSSVFSPVTSPLVPLGLWTGGLRTSLGVENAHPLSVWMKEMQARGGLKGVDIEKELLGFALPPPPTSATPPSDASPITSEEVQRESSKHWKQKRERPPIDLSKTAQPTPDGLAPVGTPGGGPTHPSELHLYPGMFSGRINHNSHSGQSPMSKYTEEITYWNYIHPDCLTSLQNGRQGKGVSREHSESPDGPCLLVGMLCGVTIC